ncbi:MAG: oxidoreductase [Desulfuromonadales bacterium]|nr:oxidoreductase [Desulfuromonadales bacterium]
MSRHGLLIDYHYCTGCQTCEVACQQEHGHPPGQSGIKVTEFVMKGRTKPVIIDHLPFPTELCILCAGRTSRGELPACVKHCQANCMQFGLLPELLEEMLKRPRTVLFRPR